MLKVKRPIFCSGYIEVVRFDCGRVIFDTLEGSKFNNLRVVFGPLGSGIPDPS